MALSDLVGNIATAIYLKLHTISLLLYLEKAFDIVNHCLLFKKLQHYCISGIANHWLSSYLAERKQYVEIKNLRPKMQNV